MKLDFIVFVLFIACSFSTEPYIKVIHNIDQEAKCLDGSPAVVYEHIGE